MYLIVGLGNPGEKYEGTRHNIGREIVQSLAEDWRTQKKLFAETAKTDNALFALPTTYMNESGKAVQQLISNFKFQISNLLVVHDDLDLPLGTLRFSQGANAAGQKGVQSIIDTLGTNDFARLRIGVAGAHRAITDAADYVLKKFSKEEQPLVAKIKKQAQEALEVFLRDGIAKAMNVFNTTRE